MVFFGGDDDDGNVFISVSFCCIAINCGTATVIVCTLVVILYQFLIFSFSFPGNQNDSLLVSGVQVG